MMKKILAVFIFLALLSLVLVACDRGASTINASVSSNGNAGSGSGNTVHLNAMSFAQSSITIGKGSSITLVDDTSTLHVIANGSWVNGTAQSMQEHGAPTMNNMQISGSGSTQSVGPFTAAGTFHLYCPVHPGMNLTVVVK